jgi:hypothetical protein
VPSHRSAHGSWFNVITPRRLVTTALLLLAVVLSVYGLQSVKDQRAASCSYGPVTRLLPCPGDRDLSQGEIGVEMAAGYQAELTVDNTVVPVDELSVQGSGFFYTPGPGTATGALAPGAHTATVTYYPAAAGPAAAQKYAWNFSTT